MFSGTSAISRRTGRARVAAGGDDLADERLPGDDAEQAAVVADEDRPHLGPLERLAGLLRARARRRAAADRRPWRRAPCPSGIEAAGVERAGHLADPGHERCGAEA